MVVVVVLLVVVVVIVWGGGGDDVIVLSVGLHCLHWCGIVHSHVKMHLPVMEMFICSPFSVW